MKLWEKDYQLDKQIEAFTVGEDHLLDQRLVKFDCLASIAHARMLGEIGILNKTEVEQVVDELDQIILLDSRGQFIIQKEDEDCHTAIENHLTEKLGELGKKIHTARSRNDQVLTALRLYYKTELADFKKLANVFISALRSFIKKYNNVQFPGYTHTRKAMPASIAMWGNAFIDAMLDNLKVIDLAWELVDQSPLGTGAGYGVPLEIDRQFTAKLLGFRKVQKNPVYTQHSRGKFESTILHALSQIMFDLNKIATDLILFSMPELGYFELPDEFCTGSSIMPQKKNPDVLELVRAKYHVVVSYEMQVKQICSNLISGYHRDFQLTKEPIMKGVDLTRQCMAVMRLVFSGLKVNKANCANALTGEVFATDEVYKLVKAGMPFREAYQIVAKKY